MFEQIVQQFLSFSYRFLILFFHLRHNFDLRSNFCKFINFLGE